MAIQKETIFLSNEDYETLVTTGSVTIGGDTLTYSPDDTIYITPDNIDWNDINNKPIIPDAVIANPILAGTEADLTGLQVGNTKYKVSGGEQLPSHDSSKENYVLSVDSSGNLVWKAPYDGTASGS